jgi:hypothetical protein
MNDPQEYALRKDDLIRAVSVSSPIPTELKHHTLHIILLAIGRATGTCDVLAIFKSLKKRQEVRQDIQAQIGVEPDHIAGRFEALKARYAEQIEKSGNQHIRWDGLELNPQLSRSAQLATIRKWGKANIGTGLWSW